MQEDGLRFLIMLDRQAEAEREREQMRLAILSARPELARGLYPGYFDPEVNTEVVEDATGEAFDGEDTTLDFRKVEWVSPDDLTDPDIEMLNRMLGNNTITVTNLPRASEGVEEDSGLTAEPDTTEWI